MPSSTIKTVLVSSLLLLQGVSAAPVTGTDVLSSNTRPHWNSNTLTISGGKIHNKRTNHPGQEIEEMLREALRKNPDMKVNPMYEGSELEMLVEELRKEVALETKMEGAREGEQKVVR